MELYFGKKEFAGQRRIVWDTDYEKGVWDYLKDELEASRYDTILQAIWQFAPQGSILEVGCGEGILQSRMVPDSYHKFFGIDISKVAIRKASYLCNAAVRYAYADMEKFAVEDKFDVIVFNESIYYAKNPVRLMKRYAQFLQLKGHIIISIFETEENRQLLNSFEATYLLKQQWVSTNERGSWYCQVYSRESILSVTQV